MGGKGVPEPLICRDPVPWQMVSWPPQVSTLPASSEARLGQEEFGEAGGDFCSPSGGLRFLSQLIT